MFEAVVRGTPIFSPDSSKVAYIGKLGNKCYFFINDELIREHDDVLNYSLIFSPDSSKTAYIALTVGKWLSHDSYFVVTDKTHTKPYDDILDGSLIFSPDSSKIAYVARRKDNFYVVIDENEGMAYENIVMTYSKDGYKRQTYGFSFNSSGNIEYLILDGNDLYRIEEKV